MTDIASAETWTAHQIWLRTHVSRERERLAWTEQDWLMARQVADVRHERSPDTYLWSALKGVEQAHWCWARRRLK